MASLTGNSFTNAFVRSFYPTEIGRFSNTMNISLLGEGLIVFRAVRFLSQEHIYFFNQVCIVYLHDISFFTWFIVDGSPIHVDLTPNSARVRHPVPLRDEDVCGTRYRGAYN